MNTPRLQLDFAEAVRGIRARRAIRTAAAVMSLVGFISVLLNKSFGPVLLFQFIVFYFIEAVSRVWVTINRRVGG
jgi:hypothetical protein